jgi:hypothetical protein
MRQPASPPRVWNQQQILDYLNVLNDDLYPKAQAWNPVVTGVTGDVSASFVRQAALLLISVFISGPTISGSGEVSLPFLANGDYILSVKAGASMLPAIVYKSTSTLVLPDWNEAGNIIISGVIAV